MNQNATLQWCVVILAVVVAGCGTVPQGDATHISLYGEENQTASDIALNPITYSESEFRIEGDLVAGGGAPDRETYRDVSILLYAEDSTLVCSVTLGDWNPAEQMRVELSTNEIPQYVIIHSPDFWREPMSVEYFVRNEEPDEFVPHDASSRQELPVRVENVPQRECTQV